MSEDLLRLPLRELGRRLRQGELSPLALAEESLARLEHDGPRYNAVVTVTRERALAEARRAEAELRAGHVRGPLHGIPYGAKDLLATGGGIPTTWGFEPLREQTFAADAAVIERLEAAGAVLVAKLAMVELAGGMKYDQPNAAFTGPGLNPWDTGAWSGGSSSGSGSAVGAGLVPFAIGSETHGSIVGPAAYCGVTGVRPSFGRVSRRGAMALSWTLDKIGPLVRSADDGGLVLEAIAGPDPADETTLPEAWRYGPVRPRGDRWRVVVLADMEPAGDAAVQANFEAALDVLRPVADVETRRLPELPYHEAALTILWSEAAAAFTHLWGHEGWAERLTAPETRGTPYALETLRAADYVNALRLRQAMQRELAGWLRGVDAVVTWSMPREAPPLDVRFSDYFKPTWRTRIASLGNLLGLPCVAVPSGFGPRGLPTGIQFVGAPLRENTVLALADHYQRHTDWNRRLPPAP